MGGIAQNITLGAGERRMIRLPASVPEPSADAAVLRLGDQLGRLMTLPITARLDDGETVRASVDLLVAPTGLPQRAALRLVADRDGAVHLREAPPAGALVEISVRAWPDAAARRADELSAWRQRRDARGLMAWLAAPPGAERRSALAARWPLAGDDAASQVARLAARRAGLGGGPTVLPEGVIGGWIAGLALPPPAIRGLVGRSEGERAAAAAAGLLEGWAEAPAAWAALAARWSDGLPEDPLALACGIEAARLAGDQSAAERLIAALATADWSDDLVAVLAAELLPEAGAAQAAPVTLAAGGIEVRIEAAAGARWAGLVPVAPLLRAAPGTLLAIDLRWQAPAPAQGDGTAEPLEIWQAGAEGFELLAPGAALWPDRPVVLRARPGAGRHVTLALPALLRPAPAGEVSLVLGSEELWPLPEAAAALLDGATPAPLAAQRIAPLLAAQPKLVRPIGERVQTVAAAEAGDGGLLELRDGEAIAVATTGLGRAAWPELRITDADGFRTVVLPDLRVAPGDARAAEGERGHPLRERIVAAIASAEPDELGLIAGAGPTVADWEAVLRTLDPGAAHQLADLLAHPRCGQPGHWTRDALRRWIDGSPGLASARSEGRETGLLFAEVDLAELISRAAADRSDRDAAQAALRGGPAAPALLPEPPVRAWFEALRAGGRIDEEAWEPWLWRQPLAAADIAALGYPPSIDGWVLFCRRELGLDFAIGRGVPADLACPEGEELGLIGLRAVGLEVVRRPDAGLELRAARADQRALGIELAIDCTDLRPLDALAALNQALALRGLPTVALAPGLDASALPAVTCQAHGGWTTVADALAAALELERRGSVLGRR
jgi:hypothetical protein